MIPIIELLLHHGANPLNEHRPGQTILHALCREQGIIEPFLGKYDLETRDSKGNTLLLSACQQKEDRFYDYKTDGTFPCTIGMLLAQGANARAVHHKAQNALHVLLSRAYGERKITLVERDFATIMSCASASSLIHQLDDSGKTPLLLACQNEHLFAIDALLSTGADPLITNKDGNTRLYHISPYMWGSKKLDYNYKSHSDLAKSGFQTFLSLGVSINQRNNRGQTPLHIAFQHVHNLKPTALDFYLAAGADPRARDGEGGDLLHYLASIPQKLDARFHPRGAGGKKPRGMKMRFGGC